MLSDRTMASYELELRETDDPRVVLVDVAGELDLTNAREFEEQLDELSAGEPILVLDLNRLVFVDSAALHALFRTARRLGKSRFGFVLEPTAAIARTLTIVGLPEIVTVRASLAEVEAALASPTT